MRVPDKKILLKSDYLRKEAELYIDYISKGDDVEKNSFMCKSLKEINEGAIYLNNWVYDQTKALLDQGKLVAVLGGDHSTALGFYKSIAEKFLLLAFCRSTRIATSGSLMKASVTAMPA